MTPDPQENHEDLKPTHTPEGVSARLLQQKKHSYLKDFVYGAIDGTVTTFAVVSGVQGASLSPYIIIVLGIANLIGDGFSMAVSNFLATRAEEQLRDRARRIEEHHIREIPEGEREEIRQIFAAKGFTGRELEKIVQVITRDKSLWVNTMLQEELGLPLDGPSPWRAGLSTFLAFIAVGAIPLLPFIWSAGSQSLAQLSFIQSSFLTACTFFFIGALKGKYVDHKWYWSGLETLFVGACAAVLAYLVGALLHGIVPSGG